jgi:uncharacterized protein involved in cysteine biosynthesis
MLIGPARQVALVLAAPLSLFRLPRKSWGYFILYLTLCALVLGGSGYFIFRSEDLFRDLVLAYLFPESWHPAMGYVADRFLEAQSRIVIANLAVVGSLGLVAILLFPFKEMLSASFEREAGLINDPEEEHPLWEQAWEEIKLFIGVIAIQGTVFWIGYTTTGWRVVAAAVLGNVLTFAVYAVDFISPPFQRHYGHYSRILKTLAVHPIASLGFGAIFAAPALIASTAFTDMRLESMVAWTCAINVVGIAWAAVAGTWLGSKLYPDFKRARRSSPPARVLVWLLVGGLLAGNVYTFGALTYSVHKKSQLLKCEYSMVWSSFRVDLPGLTAMLRDEVKLGLSFEVEIENPTGTPVELEENRIELRHQGDLVGTARLEPFRVDGGAAVTQRVGAGVAVAPSFIAKRRLSLLDAKSWSITLFVEVAPGFEFPVYLIE